MTTPIPDYTAWTMARLTGQREHLQRILLAGAGQNDPLRPQLRKELVAIREEIQRRAEESQ
jgi:hypothetical protein